MGVAPQLKRVTRSPAYVSFFKRVVKNWKKMHYYQFSIGDYRAATAHLSNDEDLAYRRLLDMYYDTEQKIPLDTQWVARRLRIATEVVDVVLKDMFVQHEDGWFHARCHDVIHQYHAMAEKNRANGRLGGRKKNPMANQLENEAEPIAKATNNQELETNNQKLFIKEGKPSLSGTTFPPCPHKELLNLWAKHLPHLTQPRSWEGSRQSNLKQRWIQAGKPSDYSPEGYKTTEAGIKWWDSFFGYIAKDTKLSAGFESQGRTWRPDLEWIVNATNFQKIIDGKYDK